jgi:hypothetical protein
MLYQKSLFLLRQENKDRYSTAAEEHNISTGLINIQDKLNIENVFYQNNKYSNSQYFPLNDQDKARFYLIRILAYHF